ncbi:MAG: peptide chain release factor N(5)-glutamine methyltransferase [Clostridia bacterium]|jgi:release factor glutamine methyltransferase|nr:peptide chain release factor N(5)-glutamine methyltransferase [Clostridia bacterium]
MTFSELYGALSEKLVPAVGYTEEAKAEAREILRYCYKEDFSSLMLKELSEKGTVDTDEDIIDRAFQMVEEILEGRPVSYVTGVRNFMGYDMKVDERVLIPRSETELLCEEAIGLIKKTGAENVLDLCTGSGCIAVLLALKTDAAVTASDISPDALEVARNNASLNGAKVRFIKSDLFDRLDGRFDIIVSNPPYIDDKAYSELDPRVRKHEPAIALKGGDDGLKFYRKIISEAKTFLNPGGYLLLEIGYDQKEAVEGLMRQYDYTDIRSYKDYSGNDRIVMARRPNGDAEKT